MNTFSVQQAPHRSSPSWHSPWSPASAPIISSQPTTARAAATSNTAPLDDSKIAPLLSLDQAMETVAARVTPAIVNVAVTSKVNQKAR